MSKQEFNPDYAVPPGETLLETIRALELTQKELALRMGRPVKTINEIIKGVAAITAETSLQLEKVTGVPASFWNNAEANYRGRLARLKEQRRIETQTQWLKSFSYSKIVELGLVPSSSEKRERVENLLRFFGVASEAQWRTAYAGLTGAAREAAGLKSELGDLSVWLRAGELDARESVCKSYDMSRFKQTLSEIRILTRQSPPNVWAEVCRLCAEAGVVVVLVPELPKTHVYGFTRWLTKDKALLQLSLRYKTDDVLWFTFSTKRLISSFTARRTSSSSFVGRMIQRKMQPTAGPRTFSSLRGLGMVLSKRCRNGSRRGLLRTSLMTKASPLASS